MAPWAQFLPLLIPLAVMAVLAPRLLRPRKLRIERLWAAPALMAVFAALLVSQGPKAGPLAWALYFASSAGGAVVGWLRGRFTQIHVDPVSHEITSQGTAAGMAFILAVFAARYGLRYLMTGPGGFSLVHISAARIADALILFAVGVMAAQRVEIGLRAKRLLNRARAAQANMANGDSPSP